MFDYLDCELNLFLGGKFKVECICLSIRRVLGGYYDYAVFKVDCRQAITALKGLGHCIRCPKCSRAFFRFLILSYTNSCCGCENADPNFLMMDESFGGSV